MKTGDIPLTRHVRKAGCASKIGQADLNKILSKLPPVDDSRVLVGTAAGDDAGVYRVDDRYCLVQTVDVFTPCVDDPYLFGQICAANSLSDVYAMGGRPVTALSIVGFPIDDLEGSIMETILCGGVDKLNEAGCPLVGGHSINDEEIKCGFAITGLIDEKQVVERNRARPGDALVLTKPIGTGMVAFGAQIGRISAECLEEVGRSMAALNRDAAELMTKYNAHACTDITGFGLAGHLVEMVRRSGVDAEVDLSAVPVFRAVKACLENGIFPGAIERNQEYSMAWIKAQEGSGEENLPVLYDPQTSGGLLIALDKEKAKALVDELREAGNESASIIGTITEKDAAHDEGVVKVTSLRLENLIGREEVFPRIQKEGSKPMQKKKTPKPEPELSCCDSPPDPSGAAFQSQDALPLFKEFMAKASAPGNIDKRAKKLIAVALSIAVRCRPCVVSHMKAALAMGITKEEIDEAADLAISFGGCSAMMMYKEVCMEMKV